MNIVIIGVSKLSRHVASILTRERHNVIVIDKDQKLLQEMSSNIDVATRVGSVTDWHLLDDLLSLPPDLFLALLENDDTNLVACSIAKHLQYNRTVAYIHDDRYVDNTRLDFGRIFGVDYFLTPELLVANEIIQTILIPGSIRVEQFAHGALMARILIIPKEWKGQNRLRQLDLPENIIVGLIKRQVEGKTQIIFPHGNDLILPSDEVTFIGATDSVLRIHELFGIEEEKVDSVTIAGGSTIGFYLARKLVTYDIEVRIIDNDNERCAYLAEHLPRCRILKHDAMDPDFLKEERIDEDSLFVASMSNDEKNIFASIMAKQIGCPKAILLLNNTKYYPFVSRLGIRYVSSPIVSGASQIASQLFSGKVTSLVSLYDNAAEIVEINVSMNSRLAGIPLSELGPFLPKDLLIVMIQNRGQIMIAHGNRIISPGDTVIVVTSPDHLSELSRIF